ncbi:hypothetical protein JG688_00010723 [Phytophthora aleatoria]|uniref:MIP18 family-like domain-containing protein n=1 Tax=Phytophthora aleatoria TaxID=2496075 RepID=A0A8J5J4P6_9STRA|nr:hypothetical protein JG688_00010723 [Phytophthora aleatoria]
MGLQEKINANPTVYAVTTPTRKKFDVDEALDEDVADPFEADEVFEILRHINDPEHPLTLEQLKVMSLENIHVDDANSRVKIYFTPTIPHCSMATLIGLCLRVKLLRSLPPRFKVDIFITPGTHSSEAAVNKQLNDKERVAAALENSHLLTVVNKCIAHTDKLNHAIDRNEALEELLAFVKEVVNVEIGRLAVIAVLGWEEIVRMVVVSEQIEYLLGVF